MWGLSQRYDLGDPHPLVGSSAPDFELTDGTRLGARLQNGRAAMIDFGSDVALADLARGFPSRVEYVRTGAKDTVGLRALLIQPDGIVAWVAEAEPDVAAAKAALQRWFGASAEGR